MSGKFENGTPKDLKTENYLVPAAKSLLDRAFKSHHRHYGLRSTSCQVYDTAWVAMVPKTTDSVKRWLFPQCFHYLLKTQAADGSWGHLPTTQTAGILDTTSAVLALVSHVREPLQILDVSPDELSLRIDQGVASIKRQLAVWNDVEETNHIGVEVIVPALLSMLEKELGVSLFEFPCKHVLDRMHEEKVSHFDLEKVYDKPSSVLHSLEAPLGKLDFDFLFHHLHRGSMMASPSSTATYLIGASKWDDEAEDYLRHIMKNGAGHGDGSISGTFPTTHFECSWGGFTLKQSDCDGLRGLSTMLFDALKDENGRTTGTNNDIAPHTADVYDTAEALLALSLVDRHASPDIMIKVFEGKNHFTTFGLERDPSLTSSLHVLLSLLKQLNLCQYHLQILKTTLFICQWWWDSDHHVKDKWNLSYLYPTMLLVEAFTEVLHLIDGGNLSGVLDDGLKYKAGLSVFQAVLRIVLNQDDDGSGGGYREQTCYAILALTQARHISFLAHMGDKIQSCDLTWTSKTAYEVGFVTEAYKLAALKSASLEVPAATVGHSVISAVSSSDLEQYMQLVHNTSVDSAVTYGPVRYGNGHQHEPKNIGQVEHTLTRFTNRVLNHKDVLRSSSCDQDTLRQEFRTFMHAHATQLEENSRFCKQASSDVFCSPEKSYFQWVNSTGGSHVACA
ncbi:gibberellin cluster-kaurensynthase [Fusarium heterosporum]|uniref:Gibberellin cluster-kaurensynthase n=1 Tax=Fusarium heterosporum TaxID=42747 RepID=A0A8H5SQP1_FUSHE|nr:gibberellin cluster-kaurensynthase [Fusarium heterosporum]